MSPPDREAIASGLGIEKCGHCTQLCLYCPRLLEARPDLRPPNPPHEAEDAAARRAGKPRVPLGCGQCHGKETA
jgi:hypothetical protein